MVICDLLRALIVLGFLLVRRPEHMLVFSRLEGVPVIPQYPREPGNSRGGIRFGGKFTSFSPFFVDLNPLLIFYVVRSSNNGWVSMKISSQSLLGIKKDQHTQRSKIK